MTAKKDESAASLVGGLKEEVKTEAAREVAKEVVKDEIALDTGTTSDAEPTADAKYQGHTEIMLFAHNLDLGVDAFEKLIADKESGLPEEKIYGLLALERNGQNRTPYVKAMMKRLKLKANELPGGGPSYTNDISNITDL